MPELKHLSYTIMTWIDTVGEKQEEVEIVFKERRTWTIIEVMELTAEVNSIALELES